MIEILVDGVRQNIAPIPGGLYDQDYGVTVGYCEGSVPTEPECMAYALLLLDPFLDVHHPWMQS